MRLLLYLLAVLLGAAGTEQPEGGYSGPPAYLRGSVARGWALK